jgi:ABC-2 type transport system permease protein
MSEPTGAIHDLGYKRYVGTRRPPATRWRVIMRHQIAMGWKTWWRYKASLGVAVIVTFVAGGFMYFGSTSGLIGEVMRRSPIPISPLDIPLPFAINWYCRAAFVMSLTIGAGVIAGDVQSGAFTFYFARSVRPIDYLLGKLGGLALLVATLTIGGPLLLTALRLGLSETTADLQDHLTMIPKVLAVGALATLTYAAVPLGFSALIGNRRYALAMWAAYYLIGGTIAAAIGFVSSSSFGALDLPTAIQTVTFDLFDVGFMRGRHGDVSLTAALVSIAVHVVGSIAIIWYQLGNAQKTGVGGAS